MNRHEEPRVGAFAACPFCGETRRIDFVTKRLRRGDGEWPIATYVRCMSCNARGPLMTSPQGLTDEPAAAAWNGELRDWRGVEGGLFK